MCTLLSCCSLYNNKACMTKYVYGNWTGTLCVCHHNHQHRHHLSCCLLQKLACKQEESQRDEMWTSRTERWWSSFAGYLWLSLLLLLQQCYHILSSPFKLCCQKLKKIMLVKRFASACNSILTLSTSQVIISSCCCTTTNPFRCTVTAARLHVSNRSSSVHQNQTTFLALS